jgi:hypothetical protein
MEARKTVIKLDYDKKVRWGRDRFLTIVDMLRLRISKLRVHETNRGLHICFEVERELSPVQVVCLQSLFGSDYRREAFNFMRASDLRNKDDFVRNHWNVLFARKYEWNGEEWAEISREVRREDIEKELFIKIKQIEEGWKMLKNTNEELKTIKQIEQEWRERGWI